MKPRHVLPAWRTALASLLGAAGLLSVSCDRAGPGDGATTPDPDDALARIGSVTISQRDLEFRLRDHYSGRNDDAARKAALDDLVETARFAQAALDAGLADDVVVRSEVARLLQARLREQHLSPKLKQQLDIPQDRLLEIYETEKSRFQSPEQRQVAVLWLDPGADQQKTKRYAEKLEHARDFLLQSEDLSAHPEKGFGPLGADFSEHAASRFRGGIVGWMKQPGGPDAWHRAVARIGFSLKNTGDISEVVTTPEGVFLVRLIDLRAAITRPFESVVPELEREEKSRLQRELETGFVQELESRFPVEWLSE